MNITLPESLKNYSLETDRPDCIDELLNALYWYAEKQTQLAEKRQQSEVAAQWKQRVKALDEACKILDEIDQDDTFYLIY
jgi:hypothetical protein